MTFVGMNATLQWNRRDLLKAAGLGTAVASRLVLGVPAFGEEQPASTEPETNVADFLKVPRGPHAIPGPYPGRVVKVTDPRSLRGDRVDPRVARAMVRRGIAALTGESLEKSFARLFAPSDVVGIKVNPVGAPLINTHPEVVAAIVEWLTECGLPAGNIVIWDRFDDGLQEAGYTTARFPGVRIASLQTMAAEGKSFRDAEGNHISAGNFDMDAFYFVKGVVGKGVRGYQDDEFYLNQHVFAGEHSYFGTLVTKRLTKIINVAAYKNTGNSVSMATKNLGYAAICNTGRLHAPLGLKVSTEVLAAPWVRDKLVLNIIDGIRAQYEGGPMLAEKFVYPNHSVHVATDPFAIDMIGHREIVARRKAAGMTVNEHPKFADYLHYGERLGLGVADPEKIKVVRA